MGEKINLGEAKLFFCPAKDVGTENEKWSEAELKSIDGLSVRKTTEMKEINEERVTDYSRSFSFSIDCPIEGDVEKLFRSLTRPLKKRKGERQRRKEVRKWRFISGLLHYLKKKLGPKPRRTIFDVRRENELRKLWVPF